MAAQAKEPRLIVQVHGTRLAATQPKRNGGPGTGPGPPPSCVLETSSYMLYSMTPP
jgi:hypothetical protein